MPSINSLGYPLVYKAPNSTDWASISTIADIAMRTEVRALEGMQKEALVYYGPTQTVWRMVSDEGPYLNGTDLAPFPLAFYTAGMAFSFVSTLLELVEHHKGTLSRIELVQDNFYTMQGSALRGDMIGGCLPAELAITIETDIADSEMQALLDRATIASPPQAYNANVLQNVFSLTHNGIHSSVTRVRESADPKHDPQPHFDAAKPRKEAVRDDIIVKVNSAETLFNVEGGAGSSLKSEQKRTLHVRGMVTIGNDGLLECSVQLFKPIGSTFRFLCDPAGQAAPPPLAYTSAGVGFCFMTQVGRYATIVKQDLHAYRIVQDNAFTHQDGAAIALPMDTHLFVELNGSLDAAQTLLSMSEQTCFLHAAMRSECPSNVQLKIEPAHQTTAE